MNAAARSERTRLRRVLGPLEVTASGVGIIIGAGIYVLLGAATSHAGNAVWMSFAVAALLCGLTGLSYAELASMFPNAGAEYDYTRRVFPRRLAFLVGWTMVVGLMVAAAAIAVGFAHYLQYFADLPLGATAVALLVADTAIALAGIHRSARLTVMLSALQVAGLLVVIAIGATHLGSRSVISDASVSGVIGGAALVFFAFIGFDEVITLAEETRDPTRTIPRALFAALGISTVLYMAVAIAAVSVIGASALAGSTRPLADVMAHVLGGRAEAAVAVIALITTTNTSLLALTAASRLTYGMADTGALPAVAATISRRNQVPTVAIVVVAVGAIAFAAAGDMTLIASVTDFAVYAVFLAVNTAVIVLRRRAPDTPRQFRTPGSIAGIPVLPVAGSLAALAMVPRLEARALWLGAVLLLVGWVAGHFLDRGTPPLCTRELLHERLADARGGRVGFVSHCLLNENVRYLGGATTAGVVDSVVDDLRRRGIGIVQMSCPEQLAWGGVDKPWMLRLYGSRLARSPIGRRAVPCVARRWTMHRYRELARRVAGDIQDYVTAGYDVTEILGVGSSPSCGAFTTIDLDAAVQTMATLDLSTIDTGQVNERVVSSNTITGRGLFLAALTAELERRHITVPLREHDLVAELRQQSQPRGRDPIARPS